MKGWDIALGELSSDLRQRIAAAQGLTSKPATVEPCEDKGEVHERFTGPESSLQRQCELLLQSRGYWPRDFKHLHAAPPPSGWYIHLRKAEGNPIMLDLLVMREDNRFIEIELKKDKGRLSDQQKILLSCGGRLAYSIDEFIAIINEWEERNNAV